MGYSNKGNTAGKTAAPGTNNGNFTKANGFVNVYINGKGGSKKKLGFIALYNHKEQEADLMAWLQPTADTEEATVNLRRERLAKLLDSISIDFQAVSDEPRTFDLPE
jgi:dissimilatory sulfite reductase (desulfoviridin) alpha/beta subunit